MVGILGEEKNWTRSNQTLTVAVSTE